MSDASWINILLVYAIVSGCALLLVAKYAYRMGRKMKDVTDPFEKLREFRKLNSGNNGHRKAS